MQKLGDKKVRIIPEKGQNVSKPIASKKGSSFFGFFTSSKAELPKKMGATSFKEPLLKGSHLNVPRANLAAVKNWVGLEEKIIHDYKEQKTLSSQPLPPPLKIPAKQPSSAFETFSTQTTVSLLPGVPKLKGPLRAHPDRPSGVKVFWVFSAFVAGIFAFLYMQGVWASRETSQKLVQLENESAQLEQSYAALENISENRGAQVRELNSQLREMSAELKAAKDENSAYDRSLEKKYREELMRITIQYESQLSALRAAVLGKEAVVEALKAQVHSFEKILEQVRMSAVSGVTSRFFQKPVLVPGITTLQGEITAVNGRQGFVVIDLGADRGVRSGNGVAIFREGIGLAVGHVDRVYSTMSSVVIHDTKMLSMIREGDKASFF